MEPITYILSQIAVLIEYGLLSLSYQFKDRRKILVINFLSLVASGASYFLLSAYTGLAMVGVAVIRNIYFFIREKQTRSKKTKNQTVDYIALAILLVITGIFTIFTYKNIMDIIFGLATMLLTYSLWQKNPTVYKIIGIPCGIVRISYNIMIKSIFGIVLEIIALTSAIIGIYRDKKSKSRQ